MAYAVVRVRGSEQAGSNVWTTLEQLRLHKINHMVFMPQGASTQGMLEMVKDYVTWGEVSAEMIAKVLLKRGETPGGPLGINDDFIKKNSEKYKSIISFAKAVASNEARLSHIRNLQPVIRLHPPKGGYENIKSSYKMGGSLGYRGKEIEKLLDRMIAAVPGE
jgi:large subunit ribosomal protein L30